MNLIHSYLKKKIDKYLNQLPSIPEIENLHKNYVSIGNANFRRLGAEDDRILEVNLKKLGYIKCLLPIGLLRNTHDYLIKKISRENFNDENIISGYSIPITNLLNKSALRKFKEIGFYLCKQRSIKNYIFRPRVISVEVFYSRYSAIAANKPTHAHLWHRDSDCHLNQLKIMIPLLECSDLNGMFSAISREFCPRETNLRDSSLIKKLEKLEDDHYAKSDALYRLSDSTVRSWVPNRHILDLKNNLGEAIIVDTNSCYHKGGFIKQEGKYRLLVQITIGSFIHTWIKDRSNTIKKIRNWATQYIVHNIPTKDRKEIYLGLD